jgi:preprotein translocase SecE subunit
MAKKEVSTAGANLGVEENKKAIAKNKKQQKKAAKQPRKSKVKETVSELKKVTWPSFGTVVKNTGMVLAVIVIIGLVVLGFDSLLSWLISLILGM